MNHARLTLAAATILTVVSPACRTAQPRAPKLIVLGIDGMDPGFVERHWAALPNLARLRDEGSYHRLGTTTPPQSPVAWSSFITGFDPDQHGIYDFVHRDPATLRPFSSMSRTEEPRFVLPLGPYRLPLSGAKVVSLRRGTAFWQTLAEKNIPVTVVRMPTNYPPLKSGRALAGMGTPDLRGTLGTFTFYTDDPEELTRTVPGGSIVKITLENGRAIVPLEGPPNSLRRDQPFSSVNLIIDVDPAHSAGRIKAGDDVAILKQGEWSDWLVADFPLITHITSVRGMFRVFAKQFHPRLQLYVSAVNIDPDSPALPVAQPASWGRDVVHEAGPYYTMGTPEDTSALRQGVFNLTEFLSQTRLVFEDERKLLRHSLDHFEGGLLFFYFSAIDQNSHMLWGKHDDELLNVYHAVDSAVGEVLHREPGTAEILLSDHGFSTFARAVHLNAWLRNRGSLTLKTPSGDDTGLASIDWGATEAYAVGLNGLYLNLKGRESNGIVQRGQRSEALLENLRQQLLAFRDPENGRQVVEAVYKTNPIPANAPIAPDLIVGYASGYRASWQTGLGGTPVSELEDNNDAWIADHCINPADVPGVLFTSRGVPGNAARLQDVTAMVLEFFGLHHAASR
jgi:predicted AlkP superfamily phosphohydrolase/phosphomutase